MERSARLVIEWRCRQPFNGLGQIEGDPSIPAVETELAIRQLTRFVLRSSIIKAGSVTKQIPNGYLPLRGSGVIDPFAGSGHGLMHHDHFCELRKVFRYRVGEREL